MAFVSHENKQIHCKVLYFGPHGAGKTENFRSIFKQTQEEVKQGLLEMKIDEASDVHIFDFLPLQMFKVGEYNVNLHLYSLTLPSLFKTATLTLLHGIDGLVFVADSRIEAIDHNVENWNDVKKTLNQNGYNFYDMPKVYQFNHQDSAHKIPLTHLSKELNPTSSPQFEAVAVTGIGVMETLHEISKQIVQNLAGQKI